MKRILYGLVIVIICLFISTSSVDALSFKKGSYIGNLYVNKTKNGVTHYMSMRFIKDNLGRAVYCLEPFVLFYDGKDYNEVIDYTKISDEKLRRVELLAYYGYGYEGRTHENWYAITQVLIWKEVDPDADIYFTNSLNGQRDDLAFVNEMNSLLNDVNNHDLKPDFVKDYTVNYGDNLDITGLDFANYELVCNEMSGDYFKLENIKESSVVTFKQKKTNYYINDIGIYIGEGSQDLLLPGNIDNKSYSFNINITKGNIELDIRDDDSVYSVENKFEDVCYEIFKDDVVIDFICANKEMKYLSIDLPYGDYIVKQKSTGLGYVLDKNSYKVKLNKDIARVTLKNYIITNDLDVTKYYCDNECFLEEDAEFAIYDSYDNLVTTLKTDNNGNFNYKLGYGKYYVIQNSGKEGYTKVDDFVIRVLLDKEIKEMKLEDKFIPTIKEEPIIDKKEPIVENVVMPEEGEIIPPDTGAHYFSIYPFCLIGLLIIRKIIN